MAGNSGQPGPGISGLANYFLLDHGHALLSARCFGRKADKAQEESLLFYLLHPL